MLIQSHTGTIELLPALPEAWSTGKATGLRARGGYTVDIEWKDGKVVSATIRNILGNPCSVKINSTTKTIPAVKGEATKLL
jgi:alpha-L-fucosidase 2